MNYLPKTLFACAVLCTAWIGCKKDENAGKTPAEKITGNYLVRDTGFVVPGSFFGCSENSIENYGIIVTKIAENKVEISNFKSSGTITATVTNTSLVSADESGNAYNITASLSDKTIRFSYDSGDVCVKNGRATAIKQD